MLALLCLACACEPLLEAGGCPRPCPSSCPASCLTAGYCAQSHFEAPASPPLVRRQGESLTLGLGDLPPNVLVDLKLHAVIDLPARGNTIPWDYQIKLDETDEQGDIVDIFFDAAGFDAVDFPVARDWTGSGQTDPSGAFELTVNFRICSGRAGRGDEGCVLLPASSLEATVSDLTPWEDPPACQ